MMRIYTFANGDVVHRYNRSLVAVFQGSRKVLSTSPLNGGYQEFVTALSGAVAGGMRHV